MTRENKECVLKRLYVGVLALGLLTTSLFCDFVLVCVCVPVLAVLDALAQRSSLSQRRVPTATSAGGQDAILKGQKNKIRDMLRHIEMIKKEDTAKDYEKSTWWTKD